MDIKKIKVKKLHENAIIPTKAYSYDAGWDLYYDGPSILLDCGERATFKTGVSFDMPSEFVGLIWPRSGMAVKSGIDVLAGVIDSQYTGEIIVCLLNTSKKEVKIVNRGDKIAQIIFHEIPTTELEEVNSLKNSERGGKGFGSSGV